MTSLIQGRSVGPLSSVKSVSRARPPSGRPHRAKRRRSHLADAGPEAVGVRS